MSEERSVWSGGAPALARLESCALTLQLENPKAASSLSELTSFGAHKAPDDARLEKRLEKLQRRKCMNLITMETHSRDIVISMIEDEFDVKDCFKWMGQMKTRFERRTSSSSGGAEDDIFIDICDASFQYSFEYLGNPGRLVITPLTDRIYVTATDRKSVV